MAVKMEREKHDGSGGANWSYKSCKAPVKSSPPTKTDNQCFTGRMPFLSPNQQYHSMERKASHSMDLLTPSSPGVFQLCVWPLKAPAYLGKGCDASHQPSDASTPLQKKISWLNKTKMKKALRETQTPCALAVVRFAHRPPTHHKHTNTQTGPITIHCAAS